MSENLFYIFLATISYSQALLLHLEESVVLTYFMNICSVYFLCVFFAKLIFWILAPNQKCCYPIVESFELNNISANQFTDIDFQAEIDKIEEEYERNKSSK